MARTTRYLVFRIAYSALQYGIRNTQFALLALLFVFLSARPAAAQQPTPSDDDVNRVARQMYCPVCENIPLDVCPTQACQQWRATIREKLAAGWSDQQIKDYFAQQYGDRVLATPPARGLNWLVYVLPPLGLLLGGYIVFMAIRGWKKPSDERGTTLAPRGAPRCAGVNDESNPATPPAAEPDAEYVARLEEELRKRD